MLCVLLLSARYVLRSSWDSFVVQVRLLTEEVLLPAMTMIPCNLALVNDVWGILNLHDYTDRWSIYSAFRVRHGRFLYKKHGESRSATVQ